MPRTKVPRSYIVAKVKGGWLVGPKFCRSPKVAMRACEKEDEARGYAWEIFTGSECLDALRALKLGDWSRATPPQPQDEE